jgi:plastocyanin
VLHRLSALPTGALVLVLLFAACAGGSTVGWSYAPLGPSPSSSASASPAPSAAAGSPSASDSGAATTTINIETTPDQQLSFQPDDFTISPGTTVTVDYMNNSNLPHNIHFFDGTDSNAPSLGASQIGTGPNNAQTVTFIAPAQPGDYFFWCDVHQAAMTGQYLVR